MGHLSYRVFFYDSARDEEVAANGALPHALDDVLELMDRVLSDPGSYLGLIDESGGLLQFIVDDDGAILLDFPAPGERGSYGKRTTMQECKAITRRADRRFDRTAVEGLIFERW